jgi:hypothetical protein
VKDERFDPQSLSLSPEQMAEIRAKEEKLSSKRSRPIWCKFDYEGQLELARKSRIAGYAVQAELYRLWFKSYNKSQPIALGNAVFGKLGFNRHRRIQALKDLENAGFVTVQWRKRKSPLVTVIHF